MLVILSGAKDLFHIIFLEQHGLPHMLFYPEFLNRY